jgi:hypothetical protein
MPVVDIVGANENSDVAVAQTPTGFRVAIVNYNVEEMNVTLEPRDSARTSRWIDLVIQHELGTSGSLKVKVPPGGFRALGFRGQ